MFYQTQTAHSRLFDPGDLDLCPLTLTFKLVGARDQTRLPCEFGANPFSGSQDISYTNKHKSAAVAEMGDRGHNGHVPKRGGLL